MATNGLPGVGSNDWRESHDRHQRGAQGAGDDGEIGWFRRLGEVCARSGAYCLETVMVVPITSLPAAG